MGLYGNISTLLKWKNLQDMEWGSKVAPTASEDQLHDHLRNLTIHKSMRLDEIHRRLPRELADVAVKPPSMTFEK